jgi:hypothetical protein
MEFDDSSDDMANTANDHEMASNTTSSSKLNYPNIKKTPMIMELDSKEFQTIKD